MKDCKYEIKCYDHKEEIKNENNNTKIDGYILCENCKHYIPPATYDVLYFNIIDSFNKMSTIK